VVNINKNIDENLVTVFEDTLEFSKDLPMSVSSKHTFEDIIERPTGLSKDNITVINSDTVSALVEYSKISKTCMNWHLIRNQVVLKWRKSARGIAFRCSNLSKSISNTLYPLKMSVYTQKNSIFLRISTMIIWSL
jgi:hypothetical protein